MTITCCTTAQFFRAVAELVERGMRFTANLDSLSIEIRGC
jgi:hypothetical protein